MSCEFSKELLALFVENDLPTPDAVKQVQAHVSVCAACRAYCEQLETSQSFIKSQFQLNDPKPVSQALLTDVRRSVMSQIDVTERSLGWAIRFERFLALAFRTPRYAAACFALVAVVSVSVLGQMQHSLPKTAQTAAVFSGHDTLSRPTDYREWVFVGKWRGHADVSENVYVSPDAYSEYTHTGKFPDGTVTVSETLSSDPEPAVVALKAAVKDSSRFNDGWGFYDFADAKDRLKAKAEALPQTAGCRSCHRDGWLRM
jgi:cytochrome P460